jgi:Protein of unknown function (DUF4239)
VNPLAIALIVFGCVLTSALFTLFLRTILPEHHLNKDTKDVVMLTMGLIATMAALVLGLLIASAKTSFDLENTGIQQAAANIIMLDRSLARYGPETKEIREKLQRLIADRIHQIWLEGGSAPEKVGSPEKTRVAEGMADAIRKLSPKTESQREIQSRTLQITHELMGTRWLVLVEMLNPIPPLFLVVLAFWLCILFAGFGLFSPRNATVIVAFVLCALAVSSAIFLILEMNNPFGGLIKISSLPMRYALSQLGQ